MHFAARGATLMNLDGDESTRDLQHLPEESTTRRSFEEMVGHGKS